ncbi:MAG: nucleotide exchange factor GrpE [Candidatus Spechtbacterales bacterium]
MPNRKDKEEYTEDTPEELEGKFKKLKKKLKSAEKEKKEYLDGWQRERAEFANYKKDIQKYIGETREAVKGDTISEVLVLLDNLELVAKHAPEEIAESDWYKGVQHVYRQAEQMLQSLGVQEIEAKEEDELDPVLHEAVEGEGGVIDEIVQKGYKLEDKVLRPAKVKVK